MGPLHSKKRKLTPKVEEIKFDDADRADWLTGFHKRKLQRIKHAQAIAEKKAQEEKRLDRKRLRDERSAEFQRAYEEHQRQLKKLQQAAYLDDESNSGSDGDGDEQEWEGFTEPPAVDYEAEYIDEDKYTTVTVEEIDASKEGLLRLEEANSSNDDEDKQAGHKPEVDPGQKDETEKKKRKLSNKPKQKKKKFRYESKEDRRATQMKQRQVKTKKAKARREKEG